MSSIDFGAWSTVLLILLCAGCAHPPSAPEMKREGRLIAYSDGTVKDTATGLMWAASDSPYNLDFACAKAFAENYRGGGYTDWRLPVLDELAELYKLGIRRQEEKPDQLIHIRWSIWASDENRYSGGVYSYGAYSFNVGRRVWDHPSTTFNLRALPVREDD